jgi:hypothetical protein
MTPRPNGADGNDDTPDVGNEQVIGAVHPFFARRGNYDSKFLLVIKPSFPLNHGRCGGVSVIRACKLPRILRIRRNRSYSLQP